MPTADEVILSKDEARKARMREYAKNNREKALENLRRYRANNKEYVREHARLYAQKCRNEAKEKAAELERLRAILIENGLDPSGNS